MKKIFAILLALSFITAPSVHAAKKSSPLSKTLAGKFLLQVENKGEIWYVSPKDNKRYEVRIDNLVTFVDKHGSGILKKDIDKIPIKALSLHQFDDTDQDKLYDRDEVLKGFDPYAPGEIKLPLDMEFAKKHIGKVFIEVDGHGRLWYVDNNAERWNLDWSVFMPMLHTVALGVSNKDIETIPEGEKLESKAPNAHISCRDNLDCLIATSRMCMNSSGFANDTLEFPGMEMSISFSTNIYQSDNGCKFDVYGGGSSARLNSNYYTDVYNKLIEDGYNNSSANDRINSLTEYRTYNFGSIDETYAFCSYGSPYKTSDITDILKNYKTSGLKAFDSVFNLNTDSDHPCAQENKFYGYLNPSELADQYNKGLFGLLELHYNDIFRQTEDIINETFTPIEPGPFTPEEPIDETAERNKRNDERRSDINQLITLSQNLCTQGHSVMEPITSAIQNNHFVEITGSIANLNVAELTGFTSILDPSNVGICSTENANCEYTIMLNQETKKWNACEPYILYGIEQDDGGYNLGCASKNFVKENITDVNACK